MRAILIDPFECSIVEIDFFYQSFRDIYPILSHETMPVDTFTCVQLDQGDAVFVDDEGLLKNPIRFFKMKCYDQPLAGKGLIMGSDEDGETTDAKTSLLWVHDQVKFMEFVPTYGMYQTITPWREAQ